MQLAHAGSTEGAGGGARGSGSEPAGSHNANPRAAGPGALSAALQPGARWLSSDGSRHAHAAWWRWWWWGWRQVRAPLVPSVLLQVLAV